TIDGQHGGDARPWDISLRLVHSSLEEFIQPQRAPQGPARQTRSQFRVRSNRTRWTSTCATSGSSGGGATSEGNSFSWCRSPASLKTSIVFSHRPCAESFSSPR